MAAYIKKQEVPGNAPIEAIFIFSDAKNEVNSAMGGIVNQVCIKLDTVLVTNLAYNRK
jgi:hypothetical protein